MRVLFLAIFLFLTYSEAFAQKSPRSLRESPKEIMVRDEESEEDEDPDDRSPASETEKKNEERARAPRMTSKSRPKPQHVFIAGGSRFSFFEFKEESIGSQTSSEKGSFPFPYFEVGVRPPWFRKAYFVYDYQNQSNAKTSYAGTNSRGQEFSSDNDQAFGSWGISFTYPFDMGLDIQFGYRNSRWVRDLNAGSPQYRLTYNWELLEILARYHFFETKNWNLNSFVGLGSTLRPKAEVDFSETVQGGSKNLFILQPKLAWRIGIAAEFSFNRTWALGGGVEYRQLEFGESDKQRVETLGVDFLEPSSTTKVADLKTFVRVRF